MRLFLAWLSVACVALNSCNAQTPKNPTCVISLSDTLTNITKDRVIDMSKMDCFEWDKLLIIAPSFSKKMIEERAHVTLPPDIDYGWTNSGEGRGWWIVFLKNNQVASYFFKERTHIDFNNFFHEIGDPYSFALLEKNKARFLTYDNGQVFYGTKESVIDVKLIK